MRLVDTSKLTLVTKHDSNIPPYAILSHTWGDDDDELTFQEVQNLKASKWKPDDGAPVALAMKPGFIKLRGAAAMAQSRGYQYLWIDTCCIDKTSSAELSEAINSMFRWYRDAEVCFVLLNDVSSTPASWDKTPGSVPHFVLDEISASRWLTRGWTLQELLAPSNVEFYNLSWELMCTKNSETSPNSSISTHIADITGIPSDVLNGATFLEELSIAERMSWAARRQTSRVEDLAYCLMGIFNVNMPLLYGEGDRAFLRLQEEILKGTTDQSIFAWKCSRNDVLRYQFSGLLAPSPSCFVGFGEIRKDKNLNDPSGTSAPSTITNAGLHVRFRREVVRAGEGGKCLAYLDCHALGANGQTQTLAISLVSLGGDQYARTNPDIITSLPSDAVEAQAPVSDYIYVKQLPVTGVPDIVYQVPSYNDILEVFPHQGWIEASRTIRVGRPNSEGVLGVIRYNTVAEVVDILIGIASERTSVHAAQFWCLQIPAAGTSSLIDVASQFNQDRHRLDDRKLANQSSRGTSLASVEMLRINNKQVLAVSLKEVAELDAMTITHYPELHLGDDLSVVPWLKKIEDLFEVLFEDSNWYMGRSADKQATSLGQARSWTRPIVRASDPHELSRLLRQLSTKFFQPALQSAPASWFTVEKADWSPASAFETYFSVLLIEACARNDVSATAELLDSVLKSSALVEARTVGLPPDEQQAYVAFEGFRPLHWATAFGNISVVRLLLQHNARVMSRTNLGLTSIDLASMLGHTEILGALFLAYGGMTDMYLNTVPLFESPCHLAAAYVTSNEVEPILRMLLPSSTATSSSKHRHPSNYVWNSMNETPLHRAAAMGNLIAVKAILKLDTEIDVELADAQGRTPLWHAAATGRLEIVKLFIWYGSRINRADTQGRNPIHAACRGGHAEVVQVLLDAWGKSPVPSPLSFTLSHFAAMSGSPKTLRVLRDCGQTLDDFEVGVAPIHIATVNTASYHRSRDFGLGPYSKVADYETCEDFLRHAGCDTSRRGSFSVFVDDSRPSGIAVVNSPCLPRRHHYMKYPPQVDL